MGDMVLALAMETSDAAFAVSSSTAAASASAARYWRTGRLHVMVPDEFSFCPPYPLFWFSMPGGAVWVRGASRSYAQVELSFPLEDFMRRM